MRLGKDSELAVAAYNKSPPIFFIVGFVDGHYTVKLRAVFISEKFVFGVSFVTSDGSSLFCGSNCVL